MGLAAYRGRLVSARRRERRAAERADAKAQRRQPVIIAGDNIVAASLTGEQYEARPHAELPEKRPGVHRWIVVASWVLGDDQLQAINDPDQRKLMDHENLMDLTIGCWDCELPLGTIQVDSRCPDPGGRT
jgi:hypothetical protein